MSLPFSGPNNISAYKIKPSEINLITALASGGSDVSDTFSVMGRTLVVIAQMASGQATLSAKVDAADPITDPASGGTSVTLVGTGKSFIVLNSSSTNVNAALKIVDSNWSSAFAILEIWAVTELSNSGFGWYSTDSAENGGGLLVTTLPQ